MSDKKYLNEFPELMADFQQDLNPDVDPKLVSFGSHKRIIWKCHKCGREWGTQVNNRVRGTGCTCDAMERKSKSLRSTLVGRDGSLAELCPEVAAQWHATLNGNKSPNDFTLKSTYKAGWLKEEGKVWQASIASRYKNSFDYVPTVDGQKKDNNILVEYPELANEWNYDHNDAIDIETITGGMNIKVWWQCHKGHEWKASVSSRVRGNGCPECSKERRSSFPEQAIFYYIKQMYPDAVNGYYPESKLELDIYIPSINIGIEYDGRYYHSSDRKRAIDERKNRRVKELGFVLIRIVEEGVTPPDGTEYCVKCNVLNNKPDLNKAMIDTIDLINSITCGNNKIDIDLDRDSTAILEQYISSEKENSIANNHPELLSDWHPSKNGKLKPEYIQAMSNKRFWWKCSACGYEWKSSAANRSIGHGCPACSGRVVAKGINDLFTVNPALAREWDSDKNDFTPDFVTANSNRLVWWNCSKCGYSWKTSISNRTKGTGCPACAGKVVTFEQSLAFVRPDLVEQWAYELNGDKKPDDYLPGSDVKVWWRCELGHTWKATISSRRNNGCPYCGNKRVLSGFNDLATIRPDLVNEWDYKLNTLKPDEVLSGSNKKVHWICTKGHEWEATIVSRVQGRGCPYCCGKLTIRGETDLESQYPEFSSEWNTTKNGDLKLSDVSKGSNKKVWWICSKCNNEWQARVFSRVNGQGCPYCAGKKPIKGINDLETLFPDLVAEWNWDKNGDLKPSDFMSGSNKKVFWKCNQCQYEWPAIIHSRTQGRGCPRCAGKILKNDNEME